MASFQEAIHDALVAESAWTDLVTGGTYLLDDLGRNGLTLDNAPYDAAGQMKLTAVLTVSSGGPAEVAQTAERRFLYVRLYDDTVHGWERIRAARRLLLLLPAEGGVLHRRQLESDDGHVLVSWVNAGPEFYEEELNGACASFERFYAQFRRR